MDELNAKLILDGRSELEQLTGAELSQCGAARTGATLAENRLLSARADSFQAPPDRQLMLDAAAARIVTAYDSKENTKPMITQLFTGKRLYFQAGAAFALLVLLAAVALLLPRQTLAETPGYQLVYNLGQADMHGVADTQDPRVAGLHDALHKWREQRTAAAKAEGRELTNKLSIELRNKNGEMSLALGLANADEALLEELKGVIAAVPGMPEPEVTPSTWFSNGSPDSPDGGLSLTVNDHVFNFGPGFTAEEVERVVNDWLATNMPDHQARVKVERTASAGGDEQEVQVRVVIEGTGDAAADEDATPEK